jgi:hypothetical protein
MTLKAVLTAEEHAELPEAIQEHYTLTAENKYLLDADGVDALPSVQGMKRALERFKAVGVNPEDAKRKMDRAQSVLDALGDVPELLSEIDELRAKSGNAQDVQEAVRAAIEKASKKHGTELEAKDTEIARLTKHVEDREIDQVIDAEMSKTDDNGNPIVIPACRAGVKALLKLRGPKVVWEEGKPRGVFTGELGDEIDAPVYVQAWLRTDEAKGYIPASGNTGTGAKDTGGRRGDGHKNPWMKEHFNLTEQGRILKENRATAERLARAAGKELPAA